MTFYCQSTALIVAEAESLIADLFHQHAVLFDEVVDDLGLMAIGPACEGGEEELEWEGVGHQALIMGSMGGCRMSCCCSAVEF